MIDLSQFVVLDPGYDSRRKRRPVLDRSLQLIITIYIYIWLLRGCKAPAHRRPLGCVSFTLVNPPQSISIKGGNREYLYSSITGLKIAISRLIVGLEHLTTGTGSSEARDNGQYEMREGQGPNLPLAGLYEVRHCAPPTTRSNGKHKRLFINLQLSSACEEETKQ